MAASKEQSDNISQLLRYAEEVGAIANNGLLFSKDTFDIERYERLKSISGEMMSLTSGLPSDEIAEWLAVDTHYATPKMDVRGLVIQEGEILLVKERCDARWTLPGGWCEVNESPKEAIEKEVFEETGLKVQATRLLAFFDKHKHDHPPQVPHSYKCFFLCEVVGGSLEQSTTETSAVQFIPMTELPPLSTHRVTKEQIHRIYSLAMDPDHPTIFD
ncbi:MULTISPECIES: NUDIX hydrolase [unclassified Pseudovibrio]|uniref:NUDIX hydrolase n=1 Tax=unclassified Pseudovibrio TaxID=2627060 RepID=UPI0007B2A6C7|nr:MULTISPECIES: NUDIX hydrolase [unclassified Pseudovibrio]KZL03322.1 NADH pyrophosphatase [Pseudovibrio sp. W74]KZL12224.1 NADH pyrophosphatase [Pseudovibrio sp. Ad14]